MATKEETLQKLNKMAEEAEIPTLDIEGLSLSENTFTSYGNSYDVPTLIQFAKEKGYKTFDMPLVGVYIGALKYYRYLPAAPRYGDKAGSKS